jgi:hypothetical protein
LLTGVQRITPICRRVTVRDALLILVVTGGLRGVTGGVPVGFLGLFMRFTGVL